ncbi:hypothetical protein [Actinoallomurus sp. CA-142502]|uniref:hypothetical protein n=1 Tax=Actinoallomurus sp. CA-142502 TaxID=3239885 RepID=UPI003D8A23AC
MTVEKRGRRRDLAGPASTIALCLTVAAGFVVTINALVHSGAAGCPPTPPREGRLGQQGRYRATDAKLLIPGTPRSLVVCRYEGSEITGWNLGLRSGVSVERRDVARVVERVSGASLEPGDHSCPSWASTRLTTLTAGYADAPDLVVSISDGCGTLGNGTLRGYFASGAARSALFSALPRS